MKPSICPQQPYVSRERLNFILWANYLDNRCLLGILHRTGVEIFMFVCFALFY